jgi:intracellular multiplication protein IcmG
MNLLQTEYAQKISDYETQSTSSRGKMEELTKRMNRMESTLGQLAQIIQSGRQGAITAVPSNVVMMGSSSEPAKVMEPKMIYSVQAIIPGRAWLKSEAGDTITVAEGDILRNYGRVTKIDPYDGVVNIDTGNKVITLSYGMTAD